jgi:hypothetical protein
VRSVDCGGDYWATAAALRQVPQDSLRDRRRQRAPTSHKVRAPFSSVTAVRNRAPKPKLCALGLGWIHVYLLQSTYVCESEMKLNLV